MNIYIPHSAQKENRRKFKSFNGKTTREARSSPDDNKFKNEFFVYFLKEKQQMAMVLYRFTNTIFVLVRLDFTAYFPNYHWNNSYYFHVLIIKISLKIFKNWQYKIHVRFPKIYYLKFCLELQGYLTCISRSIIQKRRYLRVSKMWSSS